jgi:hypothetical protein
MSNPLHPLQTTALIRDSYLRYLKTIYPFQDRDLRDQFWQALEQPDMVVKGPLLEASPPFQTGRSIAQLIGAGVLHPDFQELCSEPLPLQRPLYLHQEQAVVKAVRDGRNLVVATGTGSGKTEAFLIPILDHLLRERAAGTLSAGVRALLLYPMNALANDQLKRLRRVLHNFPDITFGRYTGETQEEDAKAEKSFRDQFPNEPLLDNELISRNQMRAAPPHLLLTNYAMLEYLLLRPLDNSFFDGESARFWRFIVLDEAHVYDGASGIEIAMLLRRLKDRVVRSQPGRLRCLATSATLGRGTEDYPDTARFASELFGEPFDWEEDDTGRQDVVEAARIPPAALGPVWGQGAPGLYSALDAALANSDPVDAMLERAETHHLPAELITEARQAAERFATSADATNACLYTLLRGDGRLRRLQEALEQEPCFLNKLASAIFPDRTDASELLIHMVNLAVRARPGPDDLSLLPARYHVFARALEGAFACLNVALHSKPAQNAQPVTQNSPVLPALGPQAQVADGPGKLETGAERLFLTRRETCPHCASRVFELATCPRCGAAYLVGRLVKQRRSDIVHLQDLGAQTDDMRGQRAYFVLADRLAGLDEDEAVAAEEDLDELAAEERAPYTLCLHCGAIAEGGHVSPGCGCSPDQRLVIHYVDLQGKPEPTRCVACSARSPSGIVHRFLTGQDAPVSVLATALYQNLPPAADEGMADKPGQGRKLLSFADSRQDAAFFAPYVERTYGQLLRRRLILKTLLEDESGRAGRLRVQDLVDRLLSQAEAAGQFIQRQSYDERRRLMSTWLMQELVAWDRRISLEGLGLVQFRLVRPDGWTPPPPLLGPPWNLSPDETWYLIELLLDTLRQQGAITYPPNVDPRDEAFAPRNRSLYMREGRANSKKGIFGWLPSRGSNRRLDILLKLLNSDRNPVFQKNRVSEGEEERKRIAAETLDGIWRHLTGPGSAWHDYLPAENLPREGLVHRISHLFWEVVPVEEAETSCYRCSHCRSVFHINLRGVCPAYGCPGRLEPLDASAPGWVQNHYRYLYQHMGPIPFSAQEHTAQWTSSQASRVQEQFIQGDLNALSCSTTFELGVDVGELQAVLMRNVPPTTANYVQRAGRAGRRTDSAAFALTYAQRRSHDLTHYAKPERIVAGKIRPPSVVVSNEKIVRRHAHSVLFAAFLRQAYWEEGRTFRSVGDFFDPADGSPSGPELLRQYAAGRPAEVLGALHRIVPSQLHQELDIEGWGWLRRLWQEEAEATSDEVPILDAAAREVTEDLELFRRLEEEAARERDYRRSQHFQRVAHTVRGRDLLGFLGSRNVLPKYGFPTDVVELRTSYLDLPEAGQVELQRDLRIALSEYAPGGEVVAAKRIWVSGGIYKRPGHDWPTYYYAVCPECGHFHRSAEEQIPATCTVCGGDVYGWPKLNGAYIIPEFGFVVARDEPRPSGEARPQRIYSSRVYFADYALPQKDGQTQTVPPPEPVDTLSSASVQLWKRYSRYGKLALVNPGLMGRGFRICTACGFAEPAPEMPTGRRRRSRQPEAHVNPRTGQDCAGAIHTYHLGHEFITDVLELRFAGLLASNPDYDLWWSVLFALLEGASQALGIRRDDLDGTLYRHRESPVPALVLFDNVPGGAGHVLRVAQELKLAFQTALERVADCECGEETSCYECLRNFRNQPYHDHLRRGLARDFLSGVLSSAS